jgi:hypothetical protein
MNYYVYFDGNKPYKSPCLGKIYLHTKKPTEQNIICARRTTGKNLVLKKVKLQVEDIEV